MSCEDAWHTATFERVRTDTQIASSGAKGKIIGVKISEEGVFKTPPNGVAGSLRG